MRTREINGLQAVAAFHCLEAERIQEIAEELHVELVIFDHEDFFGGGRRHQHITLGPKRVDSRLCPFLLDLRVLTAYFQLRLA